MNIVKSFCAAAACGCAVLAAAGEGLADAENGETDEESAVCIEAGLKIDSRYLTYSLIEGKDPIVTPSLCITFFDWVYVGGEAFIDVTKGNGKRGGYGNRAGKVTTYDPAVGIAHEFSLGETLGTLALDFDYIYEFIPRHKGSMNDTQYFDLRLKLKDLWLEPLLWIERDFMLDDGTYVNLELGHTFPLVGEGENATFAFRPSVAQGFGNKQRTRGYDLAQSHAGLMDGIVKGEFTWRLGDHAKIVAYAAYCDYWFDRSLRHGARARNAGWGKGCDHSWNFVGGVGVAFEF
ncbi:MAG: hypothetical protein IJI73_06120 [Kiritimatiellae bacterium]|nr:hypothetical protein [Kiritimatiellia bacterium]